MIKGCIGQKSICIVAVYKISCSFYLHIIYSLSLSIQGGPQK